MSEFSFVSIGSHTGYWIENEIKKYIGKKILLIEPVDYNFRQLKERFKNYSNIFFEQSAISDKDETLSFYYIRESSISKLKKHWASGIGSFQKDHILNHYTKRFKVKEEDIDIKKVKCLSFTSIVKKYSIQSIDKLFVDAEGSEFKILSSINYNSTLIKEIFFEKKHLDGTFKQGENFEKLKKILITQKYVVKDIDKENCIAIKQI